MRTQTTTRLRAAVLAVTMVLTGACSAANETASTDDAALGDVVTASPADDATDVTVVAAADVLPVVTYDVFLNRDPFDPVREVLAEPTSGAAEGAEPGVPAGAPEPSPEGQEPDPTQNRDGPACTTYGDVVCDGVSIALLDVRSEQGVALAVVQANDFVIEVGVGDTFLDFFRVLTIEAPCATFAYGDETFRLCVGDSLLK